MTGAKSAFSGTPEQEQLKLPLTVTGDTQATDTLATEDSFVARITRTPGNNSADVYVFNGGVPGAKTWRTADGLRFISRMIQSGVMYQTAGNPQ